MKSDMVKSGGSASRRNRDDAALCAWGFRSGAGGVGSRSFSTSDLANR